MKIQLDKCLVNYIELLHYKINATKLVLAFMLERNSKTYNKAIASYQKELVKAIIAFETAKAEVAKLLKKRFNKDVRFNIDYLTSVCEVEVINE